MANNKEKQAYMMGMEHALKVAKDQGIEALEIEMRYRSEKPLPLNVSPAELIQAVRNEDTVRRELMTQAVALAWAVQFEMKLPPSTVSKLLEAYNKAVVDVRYDDQELDRRAKKLDKCSSLAVATTQWLKEQKGKKNESANNQG